MAAIASISLSPFPSFAHSHGSRQLRSTIGGAPVTVKPASHVLPSLARRCKRSSIVSPVAFQEGINDNVSTLPVPLIDIRPYPTRKDFPPGFLFGAGSSAYQVEGGYDEGGKGLSIWDVFTHDHPKNISDRSNGDVACDQYHRYKEDVKLLKEAGMDVYRFSISWSRILPQGTIAGGINKEGIAYYNNLINELKANNITPFVTLHHFDVPFALEEKYEGFLSHRIVNDFRDYAQLCFKEFGDRVRHWSTINEPQIFTFGGYDLGISAPGRCSDRKQCEGGDSATEPYIVSHNLILAHAAAYRLYQDEFKATQKGEVGITLNAGWMYPYTTENQDHEASERQLDFQFGWYLHPLVHGDYPFIMKALVRERLPSFTPDELKLVRGSFDFIGINYYSSSCAQAKPFSSNNQVQSSADDSYVLTSADRPKHPIREKIDDSTQYMCPQGIKKLLLYTKLRYKNPPIYITENGFADDKALRYPNPPLKDRSRIHYFAAHLEELSDAIEWGANVKGFFAWSLLDSFEWVSGYTTKMGMIYVDFNGDLNRAPKHSLEWFSKICKSE